MVKMVSKGSCFNAWCTTYCWFLVICKWFLHCLYISGNFYFKFDTSFGNITIETRSLRSIDFHFFQDWGYFCTDDNDLRCVIERENKSSNKQEQSSFNWNISLVIIHVMFSVGWSNANEVSMFVYDSIRQWYVALSIIDYNH